MAQLDDQLAQLRAQAQAAVQRGDIQTANQLGSQAAQLRAQAGVARPAPAPAATQPPAVQTPPAARQINQQRPSGVQSAIQPRDRVEQQLFAQAQAQRAAGNATGYNHTIRLIAIHRVGQDQSGVGRGTTFGLNILSPVADYLGAAYDTYLSGQHHGESTDFGQNLQDRESVRQQLSRTNPVSAGAGTAAGFIATAPIAEAAIPARLTGVTRLAATAGAQGLALGAGTGAEHAQEQHQTGANALGTILTESAVEGGENAAGGWVLGHLGRAALGGLRALAGNFNPTARGFAALARTDAARGLGLTPANLLAAANRFRAATGRAPTPMEIIANAGNRAGNPNAAEAVGQVVNRGPAAQAVTQRTADQLAATRGTEVANSVLPGSGQRGAQQVVTDASNQAFAHLDNVVLPSSGGANTVGANVATFLGNPDVVRVIRLIRASTPSVGARLTDALDGTAPLTGRDADFLRRMLAKGGTGPSGVRFGSVQLANDLTAILNRATLGRYGAALTQHGENAARASIAQAALNGNPERVAARVAANADPAMANSIPNAAGVRANMGTISEAATSANDIAAARPPTVSAERINSSDLAAHGAAAVATHGLSGVLSGPILAYKVLRPILARIGGISNRQAEAVANYLGAQGPNAVQAFSDQLQRARGTAAVTGIIRDVLARSALGLSHGAAEGDNVQDPQQDQPAPEPDVATPTSLPANTAGTRFTAQSIPQAYVDAMTQRESRGNATAANPNSSAVGAHQFIESTWLQTIRDHGDELGMGNVARHIARDGSVDDPAVRQRILALRNNAEISGLVVRALTADNANYLSDKLQRPPTNGELYAAHVLGPAGAWRLIQAARNNTADAASLFPREAKSNHNLFYQGRSPLSAAAVLTKLNV